MMPVVNKEPLVSIIITSYNRCKYIEKAIKSCLEQDYRNIEIVISDNHSTDNTDEIVKKYIHDKRIKYFVNDVNIGMLPNFKIATEERATGKYLTYLSSDDYFCNEKFISTGVELINRLEDIVLVVSKNTTLYEDSGEMLEDNKDHIYRYGFMKGEDLFKQFPEWFFPGWGAVLMDKNKLLNTNIFESKAQSLDYESNLKLMLQGNVAFIKEPSYVWRLHSSQASGTMNMETLINNLEFIENTYHYAKEMNNKINFDEWRHQVYYSYLNGVARRMINRKEELSSFLAYVKNNKKITINILTSPKFFLLIQLYKHYHKLKYLLKRISPSLYFSIEKDIS
jgi:glycosyltransferase involved in cell wall biosynthesis